MKFFKDAGSPSITDEAVLAKLRAAAVVFIEEAEERLPRCTVKELEERAVEIAGQAVRREFGEFLRSTRYAGLRR